MWNYIVKVQKRAYFNQDILCGGGGGYPLIIFVRASISSRWQFSLSLISCTPFIQQIKEFLNCLTHRLKSIRKVDFSATHCHG